MKFHNLQTSIETAEIILADDDAGKTDPAERFCRLVDCDIKFTCGGFAAFLARRRGACLCGTYQLRHCGATGTCTAGGHGLLASWLRAARKRQQKLAEALGGAS